VGEFLILMGAWSFSPTLVAVASLGVILAAAYVLWMVKRVFYGELTNAKNQACRPVAARDRECCCRSWRSRS
jgi:NADH-quinone oxidoreductase subunit M